MKKRLVTLLVISLVLSQFTTGTLGESLYKDIKETDWFYQNVSFLSTYSIINGYSDGSFKPNNKMRVDEFIKTVVVASRVYNLKAASGEYWAQPYIDKAIEKGYIKKGEFKYDKDITRGQMSVIIERALPIIGNETYSSETEWERFEMKISDYSKIADNQKDSVLKVYSKGALGGYPDGGFKPELTLSRAEASAVLCRIMNPDTRLAVDPITEAAWLAWKEGRRNIEVVEGVEFNPATDITKYGDVSYKKVEEFWHVALDALYFWKDPKTGKLYCKGYVPYAPKGAETYMAIDVYYNDRVTVGSKRSYYYNIGTNCGENPPFEHSIEMGKNFQFEIQGSLDNVVNFQVIFKVLTDGIYDGYIVLDYDDHYHTFYYYGDGNKSLPINWEEKFKW